MKSRFIILITLLSIFSLLKVSAQTLSPTVISSSGGFYTSSSAMISFTVAEMTMVQTFITLGNIFTQGFQQPEDYSVGLVEIPVTNANVQIYPNPTKGSFTVSYMNKDNSETTINVYNLVGQMVLTRTLTQIDGINTINFDISNFNQGIYMLGLTRSDSNGEKKTDYHKINLIY